MPPSEMLNNVPPEKIDMINGFPAPPALPLRPLHALVSVFRLVRNKEDTRQVFEAVHALSGGAGRKMFRAFGDTPYGRRVLSEPVKLEEILSDRDMLRALPDGSFGRAYLDFMEGENLTAEGLLAAGEEAGADFRGETQFEEYRRLYLHLDVCHDLWHVVTGYGRDSLGELCNLVYTRAMTFNRGFDLIILIGSLAQKMEQPSVPIINSLREANRMAQNAKWLPGFDVEELLPLPLAEARRMLNITEPVIYNSIPDDVKYSLLKPKVQTTQTERENAREAGAAAGL